MSECTALEPCVGEYQDRPNRMKGSLRKGVQFILHGSYIGEIRCESVCIRNGKRMIFKDVETGEKHNWFLSDMGLIPYGPQDTKWHLLHWCEKVE